MGGLTLEQARAAGFTPPAEPDSGGGLTAEQARAQGFTASESSPSMVRQPKSFTQSDEELGIGRDFERPYQVRSNQGLGPYVTVGRTEDEIRQAREANDPLRDDWGAQAIVGGLLGAGAGRVVQGAAKLAPKIPALVGRIAGASTEGAVASKTQGGDALSGALLGGGFSAGGSLVRGAAGKVVKKLRSPQTEIGRTLSTLDEAKAAGTMETPEFKALPKGAEGFNEAATKAEEQLAGTNSQILKNARDRYGQRIEMVLGEHGDRYHLVTETDKLLGDLAGDNTINGEVIDEHLASALGKVRRMLTTDTGELDAAATRANVSGGNMTPEMVTAPAVPVADLMKVKRAVAKLADYGSPATPETRPYRLLDKSLGKDLEGIDPRITEINREYAGTMGQLEEANDILYGSQRADVVRNTAKEKRARGLLGRVGDSTQAATLAAKDIERLKALDPRYRDALAPVEAKKASERARFGLPHVSRRIEHLPFAFAQQNATALGVHVVDPLARALAAPAEAASTPAGMFARAREEQRRIEAQRSAQLGR